MFLSSSFPVRPQPTSPFKRPLLGSTGPQFPSSTNGGGGGGMTPMQKLEQMACANNSGSVNNGGTPLHSGMLPCIADVRSPDVLHPQDGPCDCLSHPIMVSLIKRRKTDWRLNELYVVLTLNYKFNFIMIISFITNTINIFSCLFAVIKCFSFFYSPPYPQRS